MSEVTDGVEDFLGDNEEEGVVGKEGDDESVDEEDTIGDREAANHSLSHADTSEGFGVGDSENVFQGDLAADRDAQVSGGGAEGEEGPGASSERGPEGRVGRDGSGGYDTAFVSIDTKTGEEGERGNEGEGGGDSLHSESGEGEIICKRKGL